MNRILKILCGAACAVVFCFLAIGYAAVQDELLVTGSVSVQGYKPMAELSCANIDGYDFDPITGVVTIKERYLDTATGTNYIVTGIAEGGFSQTKIQAEQEKGTFASVTNPIDATSVTGFSLPRYLVTIGDNAFTGLANITTFEVDSANETFTVDNDILFNADKTMIVRYPSGNRNTYYTVPEYVTAIRADAFCDNGYCTAIVTTLYNEKAWGLPEGIMLNTSEFLDTITNITGDVNDGYTVYLEESIGYETVVLQGNDDPDNNFYGEPANVEVQHNQDGNNYVTIASSLCTPCTQHNHYSEIYLSSWQILTYAYLTENKTLEIHNCKTAIVGGKIYQWVGEDDEDHRALLNSTLYNLPTNAGDFNFLPEGYHSWDDLTKSSVKKVKVVDNIAPDTLTYGTYTSGSNVRNHTWFNNMTNCTEMQLSKLDTSKVTDMSYMFIGCKNLQELNLSTFDTSNVTTMFCMFYYCENLTKLNLDGFDTSKVKDMAVMFSDCYKLESLDVSGFDTTNVTKMYSMFNKCKSLRSLDLSRFTTDKVTRMDRMFMDAENLTTLNLSSFNTEKVTNMTQMFTNCYALTKLDISTFNTAKVTNMEEMFKGSNSLHTITVSNTFVTNKVSSYKDMFLTCTALVGGNGTAYNNNVGKTYARIDGVDGQHGYFTAADGVEVTWANVSVTVSEDAPFNWTVGSFANEKQNYFFLGEDNTIILKNADNTLYSGNVVINDGDPVIVTNGQLTISAALVIDGATITLSAAAETQLLDYSGIADLTASCYPTEIVPGQAFTITLTPDAGYILPDTVTVTINGEDKTAEVTYENGVIIIPATLTTGNITISVTAKAKQQIEVTDSFADGLTATYDPIVPIPGQPLTVYLAGETFPESVTVKIDGVEATTAVYDKDAGIITLPGDLLTATTTSITLEAVESTPAACTCEIKCSELTEACEVCKTDITNCKGAETPAGEELTCSCEIKCTELNEACEVCKTNFALCKIKEDTQPEAPAGENPPADEQGEQPGADEEQTAPPNTPPADEPSSGDGQGEQPTEDAETTTPSDVSDGDVVETEETDADGEQETTGGEETTVPTDATETAILPSEDEEDGEETEQPQDTETDPQGQE